MHDREWEARERKLDEIKQGKRMPSIAELRDLAVRHDTGDGLWTDLAGNSAEITDAERTALNDELGNGSCTTCRAPRKAVVERRGKAGEKAGGKTK